MKTGFVAACWMFTLVACAPVPEPETPPSAAPTKRAPQHEQQLPAPSNMPEIVYASVILSPPTNPRRAASMW